MYLKILRRHITLLQSVSQNKRMALQISCVTNHVLVAEEEEEEEEDRVKSSRKNAKSNRQMQVS